MLLRATLLEVGHRNRECMRTRGRWWTGGTGVGRGDRGARDGKRGIYGGASCELRRAREGARGWTYGTSWHAPIRRDKGIRKGAGSSDSGAAGKTRILRQRRQGLAGRGGIGFSIRILFCQPPKVVPGGRRPRRGDGAAALARGQRMELHWPKSAVSGAVQNTRSACRLLACHL